MAVESFAVTIDDTLYKPLEHTGYTDGDSSAQLLSCYMPSSAPSAYEVNKRHPNHYSWVLWPQKNGTTSSPYTFVGGTTSNAVADPITPDLGGGVGGIHLASLVWQLLKNGVAVVPCRVSMPATTNTNGTVPTGNGYWHAMGGVSGYYESLARPSARKDVRMAAQYVKFRARNDQSVAFASRTWGKLLPSRFGVLGSSSSGDLGAWLACAPSRAYEGGNWGQHIESTVPSVFVAANFLATWWRYATLASSAPNFPKVESGTGDDVAATTGNSSSYALCPQRYLREFSIANYLSAIGEPCIPPTWVWSDVESVSNNPGLPHIENAQSAAHEFITLLKLKFLVAPGRVFAATGTTGVVCNTSQSFSQFVDRADMSQADPDTSVASGIDAEGFAEISDPSAIDPRKACAHILSHINDDEWDREGGRIPEAGIGRRGQVNSTGSYRVPPNELRGGVIINCTSQRSAGQADLLVGDGPSRTLKRVRAGEEYRHAGQGALWLQADGGSGQVARFSTREVANI